MPRDTCASKEEEAMGQLLRIKKDEFQNLINIIVPNTVNESHFSERLESWNQIRVGGRMGRTQR